MVSIQKRSVIKSTLYWRKYFVLVLQHLKVPKPSSRKKIMKNARIYMISNTDYECPITCGIVFSSVFFTFYQNSFGHTVDSELCNCRVDDRRQPTSFKWKQLLDPSLVTDQDLNLPTFFGFYSQELLLLGYERTFICKFTGNC